MPLFDLAEDLLDCALKVKTCKLRLPVAQSTTLGFGKFERIFRVTFVANLGLNGREQSFKRGTGGPCLEEAGFFILAGRKWLVARTHLREVEVCRIADGA